MSGIYQGSTPAIPVKFEGVDLREAKVYISLYDEQKKEMYLFESGEDFSISISGSDSETTLSLTQEQTLGLGKGLITLQGRWVFPDGVAGTTQKASIQVQNAQQEGMIAYE